MCAGLVRPLSPRYAFRSNTCARARGSQRRGVALPEEELLSFGPFSLDPRQRVLLRADVPLRLTPREVDVLITLVAAHGEIVDKSRFFDEVWRGVSVEECNLSQHVAALRRVLGDDARVPIYIETVPRRGYRFLAPVARTVRPSAAALTPPPLPAPESPPSVSPPEPPPRLAPSAAELRRASRRGWAGLLVLVGLGLGLGWRTLRANAPTPAPAIRSIAVLPFENLTGDAHQDHVAEALTRALVARLAAVTGLRVEVVARAQSGHGTHDVEALVETALLSGEGRVRLAAEVIDARSGRLVWAELFESDEVAVFETGQRIALAIVDRLGGPAGEGDGAKPSNRAAAQRECALARQYLDRRSPQVVEEALEHYTEAATVDPGYAPALVGVADAYLLGAEQRVLAPAEALAGAETAARRALQLDPGLAGAHAALGAIAAARWDFEEAEARYRRALGLDPAIALVHERYAALLTVLDRHEEAVAEARVARDLSPAGPAPATALAAAYYHSGQSDAAIEQALAALRLSPRFAAAYDVLGWAHQAQGRSAEAIAAFAEAVRLSGRSPTYVAALARATARAGAPDEARRLLADLQRSARGRTASPLDLAEVFVALGETDRAIQQVERAVAVGAPWLQRVDAGLSLFALHDHARFRALMARMRHAVAKGIEPRSAAPAPARPAQQRPAPASDVAVPVIASDR